MELMSILIIAMSITRSVQSPCEKCLITEESLTCGPKYTTSAPAIDPLPGSSVSVCWPKERSCEDCHEFSPVKSYLSCCRLETGCICSVVKRFQSEVVNETAWCEFELKDPEKVTCSRKDYTIHATQTLEYKIISDSEKEGQFMLKLYQLPEYMYCEDSELAIIIKRHHPDVPYNLCKEKEVIVNFPLWPVSNLTCENFSVGNYSVFFKYLDPKRFRLQYCTEMFSIGSSETSTKPAQLIQIHDNSNYFLACWLWIILAIMAVLLGLLGIWRYYKSQGDLTLLRGSEPQLLVPQTMCPLRVCLMYRNEGHEHKQQIHYLITILDKCQCDIKYPGNVETELEIAPDPQCWIDYQLENHKQKIIFVTTSSAGRKDQLRWRGEFYEDNDTDRQNRIYEIFLSSLRNIRAYRDNIFVVYFGDSTASACKLPSVNCTGDRMYEIPKNLPELLCDMRGRKHSRDELCELEELVEYHELKRLLDCQTEEL